MAKPNGAAGFVALAGAQLLWLQFYQHHLGGSKEGAGASYSSSEHILTTFAQIGLAVEAKELRYSNDRLAF